MSTLALDLGTSTGFAWRPAKGTIVSGTWSLKATSYANQLSREARFRDHLNDLHRQARISRIFYELVRRHIGTQAAHVYGGFLGVLKLWCDDNKVALEGVAVGSIKKFWTGKGNASKDEMIAKAVQIGYSPADDNEADALAILHFMAPEGVDL